MPRRAFEAPRLFILTAIGRHPCVRLILVSSLASFFWPFCRALPLLLPSRRPSALAPAALVVAPPAAAAALRLVAQVRPVELMCLARRAPADAQRSPSENPCRPASWGKTAWRQTGSPAAISEIEPSRSPAISFRFASPPIMAATDETAGNAIAADGIYRATHRGLKQKASPHSATAPMPGKSRCAPATKKFGWFARRSILCRVLRASS
jgi:hypothetical protein